VKTKHSIFIYLHLVDLQVRCHRNWPFRVIGATVDLARTSEQQKATDFLFLIRLLKCPRQTQLSKARPKAF
jgi:hypothetical protein